MKDGADSAVSRGGAKISKQWVHGLSWSLILRAYKTNNDGSEALTASRDPKSRWSCKPELVLNRARKVMIFCLDENCQG